MARSMLSLGMFAALARWTASRSLKFIVVSPPPCLAARMISRESFVKTAPRLASAAPFWRLIVDHLECPDISDPVEKDGWTSECRTPCSYRVGERIYTAKDAKSAEVSRRPNRWPILRIRQGRQ